jgi:hypothetical protein
VDLLRETLANVCAMLYAPETETTFEAMLMTDATKNSYAEATPVASVLPCPNSLATRLGNDSVSALAGRCAR